MSLPWKQPTGQVVKTATYNRKGERAIFLPVAMVQSILVSARRPIFSAFGAVSAMQQPPLSALP